MIRYYHTYGSRSTGAIFNMQSRKPSSKHHNTGLYACELTFRIRNRIHKITAIAVKNAVDIVI